MALLETIATTRDAPTKRGRHFYYRAYGLRFRSELPIPGLEPVAPHESDVSIRLRGNFVFGASAPAVQFDGEVQRFIWPNVGALTIRGRDTIEIAPAGHEFSAMVHLPLLGAVFATLLHVRGDLVLHASAIEIDGCAVALLGDKGAGKSTTSAALLDAGHRLLADDIVAIRWDAERGPIVLPGHGELRLESDAVGAGLLADARNAPSPHKLFPKVLKQLGGRFADTPTPLSRIYVLQRGDSARAEPASGTQAFQHLLRYSYVSRFGGNANALGLARHFDQCARTSRQPGVSLLTAPHGIDRLSELVAVIEGDVRCP